MPNGGPDCCGNCFYNPHGGNCTLRGVIIADKMWTYCANFSHSEQVDAKTTGPVFSIGLYMDGYLRIPWLEDRRPKAGRYVKCYKCGDFVEDGIEIKLRSGEKFGFCCNKNYYLWWSLPENANAELPDYFEELSDCPKDEGKPVNEFSVETPKG